jgi:hypothetical protein
MTIKIATNQLKAPVRPKIRTIEDAERAVRELEDKIRELQDLVRQIAGA